MTLKKLLGNIPGVLCLHKNQSNEGISCPIAMTLYFCGRLTTVVQFSFAYTNVSWREKGLHQLKLHAMNWPEAWIFLRYQV